jgi:hypothetical protein
LAGIQISLTDDTLDAYRNGDFGYGWRLNIDDAKLHAYLGDNDGTGFGNYPPFKDVTGVLADARTCVRNCGATRGC